MRKKVSEGKMRFRLELIEVDEVEKDMVFEAHCSLPFMEAALTRGILQAIELVNRTGAVKVQNGFWLILQDNVNEALKAKEDTK